MRLWSLHPQYLDSKGLVALWREALLARAVLREATKGYRQHPQLARFRTHPAPLAAIEVYLLGVHDEASARNYAFDRSKLQLGATADTLAVTTGQLQYEWEHLLRKLAARAPQLHERWCAVGEPACHPLFHVIQGPVAAWEKMP